MINVECGSGSTGRICGDLATALEKKGCTVKIAYGRNEELIPAQFQKYAIRIGSDIDVKIHGLKARMCDAAGFGSVSTTKKFIQWVKEYNPDVIHLHNLHGYYINVQILFDYLRTCGKKILWTLHDVWSFTGHSAYCDAVQCEKWKYVCDNCPQIKVYPKSYLDKSKRNYLKKAELFTGIPGLEIITPSNWLAGLVKQSFLASYPLTVIHNGIDTKKFRKLTIKCKNKYGLNNKKIILSVATIWNDLKGYSDFIELAKMLEEEYQIIMVGRKGKDITLQVPGNIIQIDRTNSIEEMVEIYNMADVYVNLTQCDTYPTVNLEAIACGVPVVTYDVGGSTEIVLEYGGEVVERGDLKGIKTAIERVDKESLRMNFNDQLDRKRTIKEYMRRY